MGGDLIHIVCLYVCVKEKEREGKSERSELNVGSSQRNMLPANTMKIIYNALIALNQRQ